MRQMDVSDALIALPPRSSRTFDVTQDCRRHGLPIRRCQQCKDARFLALYTLHVARPVCLKKYGASQHETFAREGHNRVNWHGTLAHKPFVTQLFLQHVSLRSSMLNFRSPAGVPTSLDTNFVYAVGRPARASPLTSHWQHLPGFVEDGQKLHAIPRLVQHTKFETYPRTPAIWRARFYLHNSMIFWSAEKAERSAHERATKSDTVPVEVDGTVRRAFLHEIWYRECGTLQARGSAAIERRGPR
jgi:hypothetical protein